MRQCRQEIERLLASASSTVVGRGIKQDSSKISAVAAAAAAAADRGRQLIVSVTYFHLNGNSDEFHFF